MTVSISVPDPHNCMCNKCLWLILSLLSQSSWLRLYRMSYSCSFLYFTLLIWTFLFLINILIHESCSSNLQYLKLKKLRNITAPEPVEQSRYLVYPVSLPTVKIINKSENVFSFSKPHDPHTHMLENVLQQSAKNYNIMLI